MAQSSVVQVLEHSTVSPSPSLIPHTNFSLTLFDLEWLDLPPVQSIHLYSYNYDAAHFIQTTLPNIKRSLSLTLQHFYPFVGSLTWPKESIKPCIDCDENSVVSLTIAESSLDFDNLVGNHCRDHKIFSSLVSQLPATNSLAQVPIMALQVTLFPNKGICIGITSLHVVGDGRTISHFMKSWASVCKSELEDTSSLSPEMLPVCDRNLIKDPDNLESHRLSYLAKLNITQQSFCHQPKNSNVELDKVRATFLLGGVEIQNLRKFVVSRFDELHKKEPPLQLSSFVLKCAYMWFCLVKLLATDGEEMEIEHLIFGVDYSDIMNPPIPSTYLGNCLVPCLVDVKRCDIIGQDGLVFAAEAIVKAIRLSKEGGLPLAFGPDTMTKLFSMSKGRFLSISGSPRLGFYGLDFGWGKLKKFEVVSVSNTGAMSISERGDGEAGFEFGLALNNHQMDGFASIFEQTLLLL